MNSKLSNSLPQASFEQQEIINAIKKGENLIKVSSVAGSGKSTCGMLIGEAFPEKKIIFITYSCKLKLEMREKVREAGINNMEVHSFHALACKYYGNCKNDKMLNQVMQLNRAPRFKIYFDICIVDECQDMTNLYHRFIEKFLVDNQVPKNKIVEVILGDPLQCIFQFNGADSRFLTHAEKLRENSNFSDYSLTTTYRCPSKIVNFINNVILNRQLLVAHKKGGQVKYIVAKDDGWQAQAMKIVAIIYTLINKGNHKPDDFFILNSSVKTTTNKGDTNFVGFLVNELSRKGINFIVKDTDKPMSNDDKSFLNKVVVTTFHGSKGLERKAVIVCGFDDNYFNFFGRNEDPNICPNSFYVGVTRAEKLLILVQMGPVLRFLKDIHQYAELDGEPGTFLDSKKPNLPIKRSVTEFVKFVPFSVQQLLLPIVENLFECMFQPVVDIKISKLKRMDETYEDLADINGVALPAYFEYRKTGKSSYQKVLQDCDKSELIKLKNAILKTDKSTIEYWLKLAILLDAVNTGTIHRIRQITQYDWLSQETANEIMEVMDQALAQLDHLKFEFGVSSNYPPSKGHKRNYPPSKGHKYIVQQLEEDHKCTIVGSLDAMNENNILEFKCVDEIVEEHKWQLIIYAWLLYHDSRFLKNSWQKLAFYLFNIRTGELLQLNNNYEQINKVVEILVEHKLSQTTNTENDHLFL
jgi:hypothetical protein